MKLSYHNIHHKRNTYNSLTEINQKKKLSVKTDKKIKSTIL